MNRDDARVALRTALYVPLWCAGAAVLVMNFVLVRQNRQLRDMQLPAGTDIAVGTRLRDLNGLSLDGRLRAVPLPAAGAGLLVITFSPGCPACRENQQGWTTLTRQVEKRGWGVLWVSRDPIDITRDYCMKEHIPLSATLADPPHGMYVQLALERVPKTIVVRNDGTVERVWKGLLDGARWKDVFAYLGATNPGTLPAGDAFAAPAGACGPNALASPRQPCK